MNLKNQSLFCILVFILFPVFIGAISVKASVNKNTLSTADRLEYTIEVSNEGSFTMSEPSPPQIGNFSFVNMRSSSSSSSTIVNFKRSTRVSRTFVYYYIPKAEGKSTIPAQQIRIVNKVYSTPAFEINVVKAVGSNPSQQGPAVDPFDVYTDPDLPWSASRMQGKTLLLAQMQHHKVFKGQPVVVSYYLYTDQMVRSFNLEEEQDFPGYGKSVYEQPTMLDYERVDYQGKRFQRALIKRLVLLPNETGRVQIPRMRGSARIYEFGYMSQNITSHSEYLEVLPLPDTNVPEGFTGAVGSFQVSESMSTAKINLGGAVTFSLRIAGTGNFNQFANPVFTSTSAQISTPVAVDRLKSGIDGSRSLYYTIIPSGKGSHTLPRLSFSWFDPDARMYRTYHSPNTVIEVSGANVMSYFSGLLEGSGPKTIRPMLSRPSYPQYRSYLASWWYWLLIAIILMALGLSAWLALNEKQRNGDPAAYMRKKASRNLKRYLQESGEAAKRASKDFYLLAERGFTQFLADKYGIAKGLSTAEKIAILKEHDVPDELLLQTSDFLDQSAKARYSPEEISAMKISEDLLILTQLVSAFSGLQSKGVGK